MALPYNVSLGNLQAALRVTGGDRFAAEDLMRKRQEEDALSQPMAAQAPEVLRAPRAPEAPVFGREQPMVDDAAIPANPYPRKGGPGYDAGTIQRARQWIDSQRGAQEPVSGTGVDPEQVSRVNQALQDPTGLGPVTRKSVKALQDERIQGGNAGLGIIQQQGENAAQTLSDQSGVRGAYADQRAQSREALETRGQAMTQRTDANRQDEYAAAERIRQLAEGAPEEQRPGLKLAGDIISFIPFLSGIGRGMSNLASRKTSEARQKWESDLKGQEYRQNADIKLNASEHDDYKNELTEAQAIDVMRQTEQLDRLEQRSLQGRSEEERLASSLKFIEARDKLANYTLGLQEAVAKTAAAQRRSKEDKALLTQLAKTPEADRANMAAASAGEHGLELLTKLQKPIQGQAGIDDTRAGTDAKFAGIAKTGSDIQANEMGLKKTEAEINHLNNETKAGPKLSDGQQKVLRQARGVMPSYKAMLEYAGRVGEKKSDVPYIGIGPNAAQVGVGVDTQRINNDIIRLADPLLRDDTGAMIGEDEQANKWRGWGFLSPDQAIRNEAPARMLAEFEARVGSLDPALFQESQPAATSDAGTVMMVSPSGRQVPIPADKVAEAEAKDYKRVGNGIAAAAPRRGPMGR